MKLFNKQTTLIVFDYGSWLFNSLAFLDWGVMASCGGDGGDVSAVGDGDGAVVSAVFVNGACGYWDDELNCYVIVDVVIKQVTFSSVNVINGLNVKELINAWEDDGGEEKETSTFCVSFTFTVKLNQKSLRILNGELTIKATVDNGCGDRGDLIYKFEVTEIEIDFGEWNCNDDIKEEVRYCVGWRLHGRNIKEISRDPLSDDHSNAVWAFQF